MLGYNSSENLVVVVVVVVVVVIITVIVHDVMSIYLRDSFTKIATYDDINQIVSYLFTRSMNRVTNIFNNNSDTSSFLRGVLRYGRKSTPYALKHPLL